MWNWSARTSLVLVVGVAAVMLACSSPEGDLRKAKAAGTAQALDEFLAKHPDGPLAQEAKDAKEQLALDNAKERGTVAAYEDFLKAYPQGKLTSLAHEAIEALHFGEAAKVGTIASYEEFLRLHPKGAMAKKAGDALESILPNEPLTGSLTVTSTDPATCSVKSSVAILHKAGALALDPPPSVVPGMIDCQGTRGKTGVEIESIEQVDAHHTTLHLRSFSAEGWGGCTGSCILWVNVMGRDQAVTVTFK
jgi:hypothetical protein